MSQTAETNLYADRDITERLRELSKARWDRDAWERETTVRIPAEPDRDIDLVLASAAELIDRLRARVAKLESARREPVAWMNPYGGTLQVRITGLEYEKYTIPLYTAPPAQAVDARRYRRLFDCPEPFCYRGEVFETKVVADNAIDTDMRKTP